MSKKNANITHNSNAEAWPLIKRLARTYLRRYTSDLLVATGLMMLAAGMAGVLAKQMEPIIDQIFVAGNKAMLWPVALAVVAAFTVRGFATYGHTVILNRVGQGIVTDVQKDVFASLVRADLVFFQGHQSGQLISRMISDTVLMRGAVSDSLTGLGKNLFTLTALLAVMFYQDWQLALVSFVVFPLAALMVAKLGKKLRRVAASAQAETGNFSALLGQVFSGIRHVKAYGMEAHEEARVGASADSIFKLMCKAFRVSALAIPVTEILSGLAIGALVVYGGYQVIAGESTAGKLFSFIAAFLMAYDPIRRTAKLNGTLQTGLAAAERIFFIKDTPSDIVNRPDAKAIKVSSPAIDFDHVGFSYRDGTIALDDVSLQIPAGKKVALVGRSGAGKSTILNMIPRFYDVNSGAIRIDGIDIRDVTFESLRASMALVSQESVIFDDTVRSNIAYGRTSASEDEIIEAAKAAAAHDFILALPQGYDTRLGEQGLRLSGGQRQRIAIARAFLRDAPILLLDEATSALDADSERQIQAALEKLQKGKTTIIVAHRLSTVQNADMIYVMRDGKIAEKGTHAALLKSGGVYARLYGEIRAQEEAAA